METTHENFKSEKEALLFEIQNQCSVFADELILLVCKRAIRTINSWPVYVIPMADYYPNRFTTFDIICCEHQTKYWHEISPYLENAIDGAIDSAYDSLSPKEKFFIEYSQCYHDTRILDRTEVDKLLKSRLVNLINEHWEESKKIQEFELKSK